MLNHELGRELWMTIVFDLTPGFGLVTGTVVVVEVEPDMFKGSLFPKMLSHGL
jgi:hypothetical protein